MSHTVRPKEKIRASFGFSDDQLAAALRDIFQHYGIDPSLATVEQKQEIASRLSEVAQRAEPWGWRYVHNYMRGKVEAGGDFKQAIIGLAAMADDMPIEIVQSHPVQVQALGNLRPGTIVWGDSVKCAYIPCPVHFLPKGSRHRYHSIACRKAARKG